MYDVAYIFWSFIYDTFLWYNFSEDNARIMTEEKGLRDIVKAIQTHFRFPELMEAACATLLSLSIVGKWLHHTYILMVPPRNKPVCFGQWKYNKCTCDRLIPATILYLI